MKQTYKKWLLLGAALFVLSPVAVLAGSKNVKTNQDVILAKGEVLDKNFYGAGERVIIDGDVNGDVIAAGAQISINGNVSGDVIVAGGQVSISGEVGGSVLAAGGQIDIDGTVIENIRATGGNITISKPVGKNVLAVGGTVSLSKEGKIAKNATLVGGLLELKGVVEGDVDVIGGQLVIKNMIGGNVNATLSETADLQSDGTIVGDFTYSAPEKATFSASAVKGKVSYKILETDEKGTAQALAKKFGALWGAALLGSIAVGLVIVLVFGKVTEKTLKNFFANPGRNIGLGILFVILTPVVILLVSMTFIGLPLAMITLALYLIILYLAWMISAIALGEKILGLFMKKGAKDGGKKQPTKKSQMVLAMIIGVIILEIVVSIPFIGWLICCVATAWGFYAIVITKKELLM